MACTAKRLCVATPATCEGEGAWPIERVHAIRHTAAKTALASVSATATTTARVRTCLARATACAPSDNASVRLAGEASIVHKNCVQICVVAMGNANSRLVNAAALRAGTVRIVPSRDVLATAAATAFALKENVSAMRASRARRAVGKRALVTAITMVFAARMARAFAKITSAGTTAARAYAPIIAAAMENVRTGPACAAQVGLARRAIAQHRSAVATGTGSSRPRTERWTVTLTGQKSAPANARTAGWGSTATLFRA